jgi:hypothetical protein
VISRALSIASRLAIVLIALVPAARAQQQTGSLFFEVKAAGGSPVVGAKIAISSEKIPGQERTTDEFGKARFLLLPPSTFTAQISKDGFNPHEEKGIAVSLGQRIDVTVVLQPIMEESMEVAAPSVPTAADVDFTATRTGSVLTSEQLQRVQLGSGGRSYLVALAKVPGVVGTGNPSVHGATLGENSYTIDGVNTTDPVTGTFGLNTNFDIIDQLEVSTGGFQAEYGGATGGIINQITKSGTNTFEGTLDTRYSNQHFVDNASHFDSSLPSEFSQYSFTLTGPVSRDHLWFALSYEDSTNDATPAGTSATRKFNGHANLAKLTWEPHADHRVTFQYTEDPAKIDNGNAGAQVDPTASQHQDQGAHFYKLNYNGQLTDHWALSFLAGWYKSKLDSFPQVDSGLPSVTNNDTGVIYQNYPNAQFSSRTNDQYAFQLARAWSSSKSDHELKFGYDLQKTGLDFDSYTPAGETWLATGCPDDDPSTVVHEDACLDSADVDNDGIPDNIFALFRNVEGGPTSNPGDNRAAYVQDTWHRGRMVLDYGLRWDSAKSERDDKAIVVDVSLLEPRLGMSIDVNNDGVHKLSWSASRRMHPGILTIPSGVNTRADYSDLYLSELWFGDRNGDGDTDDGFVFRRRTGGPSGSVVDPGLDAMYVDEFIVGYEHKFQRPMRFATRLVLNETKNIIEDTFDLNTGVYTITNIPELKREYEGIELEYGWTHKRGQLLANATIAEAHGNVEYTQGLGSDYDFLPEHAVNRWGYLSTDARLRLKVFGWVDLPKKFSIGYQLAYRTGVPYERLLSLGNNPNIGYGDQFLEPRGSHRLPSLYSLDAEVRKRFALGAKERVNLHLIGTVTNLTGANAVTGVQEQDDDDPTTPLVNEGTWGQPLAWQQPRAFEVGLRLTF